MPLLALLSLLLWLILLVLPSVVLQPALQLRRL
jgi:hypothetical protein